MIALENVKKKENRIEADFWYPSHPDDWGHLSYDITREEINHVDMPKHSKGTVHSYQFGKVLFALKKMVRYNKFPSPYYYFWY